MKWWYEEEGQTAGPADENRLKELLFQGRINPQTLLWCEGMSDWTQLHEIEDLKILSNLLPPPLPKTSINAYQLKAKPWSRFFARIFDTTLESLAITFAFSFFLSLTFSGFAEWISTPGSDQLFAILCLPIAFVGDALIYSLFGNTLGKAILGLQVTTADGNKISPGQYLSRNLSMWGSAFAFGLPFINLITMLNQYSRVRKGLSAGYDEVDSFEVRAKQSSLVRIIVFAIVFCILMILLTALNAMSDVYQRNSSTQRLQTVPASQLR